MATDWAVLYCRIPAEIHRQIETAARADDRTIVKWVELHFRDFFAKEKPCPSSSDISCASPE